MASDADPPTSGLPYRGLLQPNNNFILAIYCFTVLVLQLRSAFRVSLLPEQPDQPRPLFQRHKTARTGDVIQFVVQCEISQWT